MSPYASAPAANSILLAHRAGRFLERQGLLEWDAENSYLAGVEVDDDPMSHLLGYSITYHIAAEPQAARKVLTPNPANPASLRPGESMRAKFKPYSGLSNGCRANQ